MPQWELSWRAAAVACVCLLVVGMVAGRSRRPRVAGAGAFAREAGLLFGLFALWQIAGGHSVVGVDGALGRAQWLWHTERVLHLPDEAAVQRLFLPYPYLVHAFNLYYATMHFTVLGIFLVWLFVRHRDRYSEGRTVLVLVTAACLLVQLVPVAPPRMLPGVGLVDTATVDNESVYHLSVGVVADQYSAMPSIHVAWALLVAIVVVRAGTSRWRWLAVAHFVVTVVVVVATANHFWLDGLAAALLLGLSFAAYRVGVWGWHRRPAWAAPVLASAAHEGPERSGSADAGDEATGPDRTADSGDDSGTGGSADRRGSHEAQAAEDGPISPLRGPSWWEGDPSRPATGGVRSIRHRGGTDR